MDDAGLVEVLQSVLNRGHAWRPRSAWDSQPGQALGVLGTLGLSKDQLWPKWGDFKDGKELAEHIKAHNKVAEQTVKGSLRRFNPIQVMPLVPLQRRVAISGVCE